MKKRIFPFVFLIILFSSFIFNFYGELFLQPNQFLFSHEGDGVKNYFTFASHIKNNASLSNFEGINYPYGENIFYTDGHPIFIVLLKGLATIIPEVNHYSIGILNFIMLLSFYVGGIFLFKIFRILQIDDWIAATSSFGIIVLAPQVFRMNGHFSLSYSCFLPITVYLLLQFVNSKKYNKYALLLILNLLFWLLIHPYLGVISTSMLLAYGLIVSIYFLIQKKSINWHKALHFIVILALPILSYITVIQLTNHHQHRDTNPYGFFEYYADFDTILLPHHPPLNQVIYSFLPDFTQTWEGWSYIGIGTIFLSLLFLFLSLRKTILQKRISTVLVGSPFINQLFLASLIVLIFSFSWPFRFNLQHTLDYFPLLKQFRSIGRFSWVFYFSVSIAAVYFLNQISKSWKHQLVRRVICFTLPLLMVIEGFSYHQEVGKEASQMQNYFAENQLSPDFKKTLLNIKKEKYQAILPLPFFISGSENHERNVRYQESANSMFFSYHTQLPLIGGNLARVSIIESRNSLQLLSPPIYPKYMEEDLINKKSFLILKTANSLEKDEEELLKRSKKIYHSSQIEWYELPYDSLFKNSSDLELRKFNKQKKNFIFKNSYWYLSQNFFEHTITEPLSIKKNGEQIIQESKSRNFNQPHLNASLWFYRGGKNFGQDQLNFLTFKVREILNGSILQEKKVEIKASSTIIDDWTRSDLNFIVKDTSSTLQFLTLGNDVEEKEVIIHDFLLKDYDQTVYWESKSSKWLIKNNHRINY